MTFGPIPDKSMTYVRKVVEQVLEDEDDFIAVAVLSGSREKGLALSVLGHEELSADKIEELYRLVFSDRADVQAEHRGETGGVPVFALGNSEPMPADMPEELRRIIRPSRTALGYCDHGNRLGHCIVGCG